MKSSVTELILLKANEKTAERNAEAPRCSEVLGFDHVVFNVFPLQLHPPPLSRRSWCVSFTALDVTDDSFMEDQKKIDVMILAPFLYFTVLAWC